MDYVRTFRSEAFLKFYRHATNDHTAHIITVPLTLHENITNIISFTVSNGNYYVLMRVFRSNRPTARVFPRNRRVTVVLIRYRNRPWLAGRKRLSRMVQGFPTRRRVFSEKDSRARRRFPGQGRAPDEIFARNREAPFGWDCCHGKVENDPDNGIVTPDDRLKIPRSCAECGGTKLTVRNDDLNRRPNRVSFLWRFSCVPVTVRSRNCGEYRNNFQTSSTRSRRHRIFSGSPYETPRFYRLR